MVARHHMAEFHTSEEQSFNWMAMSDSTHIAFVVKHVGSFSSVSLIYRSQLKTLCASYMRWAEIGVT